MTTPPNEQADWANVFFHGWLFTEVSGTGCASCRSTAASREAA